MLVSGLYARSLNSLPPPHSPTHLQEDPFEFLEILCLKCFWTEVLRDAHEKFEVSGWFACCCCRVVVFFFSLWMCLKQLWLSVHYCLICACFCSLSFSPYAVRTEQQLVPLPFFAAAMYCIYLSMHFAHFDSFFLVEHVIWKHYIYICMCVYIYI